MAMKRAKPARRVSVWIGFDKGDPNVDVLRVLCGVRYYDLDSQEIIVDDKGWTSQPVASLLGQLSYARSFQAQALAVAAERGITDALYAVAQYDFVYDPRKVRKKVAADPVFLGCFIYNDDESADRIQKYLDAMRDGEDERPHAPPVQRRKREHQ